MTRPNMRVIVVAYHGVDDLRICLAAIAADFTTLVVDNSSSAAIRDTARDQGAAYVDAGANLGFAAGVNLGLSLVPQNSDVLLLNPDAEIEADSVCSLHAKLHESTRLAAVSPKLRRGDGSCEQVIWPFPTPWRMWKEALGLNRMSQSADSFVIGACILIKSTALRDVGGFDERFFLYSEETDWQRRATLRGWSVMEVPGLYARHRGAGTSTDLRHRDALFHAGTETYIRKWHGRAGWSSYRAAAMFGAVLRAVVLRGERRSAAARRFVLYLRGPRRMAGLAR